MKCVTLDVEPAHLFVRHVDTNRVAILVDDSGNGEPLLCRRMRKQLDDRLKRALVQKCRSRAWGGAAAERYGATPSFAGRPMPYKFNEPRRPKIPGARYR